MISPVNFYNPIGYINFRGKDGNAEAPKSEQKKTASASIFYINDLHGNINNMSRIYNAKNTFDRLDHKGQDVFCLASGDISAGANPSVVKLSSTFLNSINLDLNTMGNHEFDAIPSEIYDINKDAKYKLLGLNIKYSNEDNPLPSLISGSVVKEINGNKYGIIGLIPPDLHSCIRDNESKKTVTPLNEDDTLAIVQKEVDKLQKEGVNKILVLSHCGLDFDKQMAQKTSGIDVIMGAHTHDLLKNIKVNENLFNSKTNEPVIITQAGRDGENFGILNVEFDENGIIKSAQNNVQSSKNFSKNQVMEEIFNTILNKKRVVGEVKSTLPPVKDRLANPNPHGFIIADACKNEFGTDIAMLNSGNIRGCFTEGILTERKLFEITPFDNKMVKMKITEEELVNAVKAGARSINKKGHRAGLIIPSGFEYTLTHDGEVKSLTFIDKNGNKIPVDINNPDKNKIYTLATDDFMASGGENLLPDKSAEIDAIYNFDKDTLAGDYIQKLGKPVEIVDDGRVKFVD
ncbi:5'-nucleotidase C-terminal domain-containing protein [bacterium]|nr:5'-nucleotidase C-terminal domain-containing protein [bacterium]